MDLFELSADGHVLTLRLCDGRRRNALSKGIRAGLWAAIDRVNQDPSVRAVVIEAEGPAFCAGGDLADMPTNHAEAVAFLGEIWDLFVAIERLPVPVIAAVAGPATGGGLELCLTSDFVVAGRDSARFALPEVKVGLVAAFAVCRLPQVVGLRRARQLAMGGAFLSAEQALDWGLVTDVVGDAEVASTAQALGHQLGAGSPVAVALTKKIMNKDCGGSERFFGMDGCAMLFGDPDTDEGITAFLQKRSPKFMGRDRPTALA